MSFSPGAKRGASHESVASSRRRMPDRVSRCSVFWRVEGGRAEALNCVVYALAADLAPNFYPALSSLRRLIMPCWACDAMAMDA